MWAVKGFTGNGNVGGLLDSLHGPAIVAGSGRGVFEEFDKLNYKFPNATVFAANDVAVYLPKVDHMVSLHSLKLHHWVALRVNMDNTTKEPDFKIHDAGIFGPNAWYQWKDLCPMPLLSGYFGMTVAYLMGCEPILLCGCPGDDTPRFWEMKCQSSAYENCQKHIKNEMSVDFKSKVRSVSGWTRNYFGCPSA